MSNIVTTQETIENGDEVIQNQLVQTLMLIGNRVLPGVLEQQRFIDSVKTLLDQKLIKLHDSGIGYVLTNTGIETCNQINDIDHL